MPCGDEKLNHVEWHDKVEYTVHLWGGSNVLRGSQIWGTIRAIMGKQT